MPHDSRCPRNFVLAKRSHKLLWVEFLVSAAQAGGTFEAGGTCSEERKVLRKKGDKACELRCSIAIGRMESYIYMGVKTRR